MTETIAGGLIGFGVGTLVAVVVFLIGRARWAREIRKDAVARSQAVIAGRVHEQLVPHLPGFEFNPKDVRFLGSPVDYVVFDGLASGSVDRVVFLEIKTGGSALTAREREVREAIQQRRVEWRELRLDPGSTG